jgi:Ca2+-binding EF-hand superfamily protein
MSRTTKPVTTSRPTSAVKQVTLSWKDKLQPEEYEGLKNTFDLFDEDHSGLIDPEEINKILQELG